MEQVIGFYGKRLACNDGLLRSVLRNNPRLTPCSPAKGATSIHLLGRERKEKQMNVSQKMPAYIGAKIVCAMPMSRSRAQAEIGNHEWDGEKTPEGYLVCYEDGYRSWSPKEVFERCYRPLTEKEKFLAI